MYVYRQGLGTPGQNLDPVYGMRTDDEGPAASHQGTAYYFCSTTCKRAFQEDPETFAGQRPQEPSQNYGQ